MATFFLINSVRVGTTLHFAGSLINDLHDNVAGIQSVGGTLIPSNNPVVAAAATQAQEARRRGAPPGDLDTIMQAAFDRSQEQQARPSIGAALTDANVTITVDQGIVRRLPAATLSTGRTITLGTTNAILGDRITVSRLDVSANTLAVANGGPGAGTLATLPVSQVGFVTSQFDGTNWLFVEGGTIG